METRCRKLAPFCMGFLLGFILFPLLYLLMTGDFPGSMIFYGLQEDSSIVIFLLNIR